MDILKKLMRGSKKLGLGRKAAKFLGGKIGSLAGKKFGRRFTGIGQAEGGEIGSSIGDKIGKFLPFKKGGKVRKTGKARVHKGEFVLPRGLRPTLMQRKAVKKRRRRK